MGYSLEKLQEKTLEVALELKRVCDRHNLRYFLSCGSLLGAVRHRGFIPWDDDMDFYMPRSDYNRLIEIDRQANEAMNAAMRGGQRCESNLSHPESKPESNLAQTLQSSPAPHKIQPNDGFGEKYIFKHWDKTPNYIWNFAKLEDRTTTAIEATIAQNNVNYKSGVGVDIFVLDGLGDEERAARRHLKILSRCGTKRYEKYWRGSPRGALPLRILKQCVLSARHPLTNFDWYMDFYKQKSKRLCERFDFDKSAFVGSPFVFCVYPRSFHHYSDFCPSVELEFEGVKFRAPSNVDAYLTRLYGDYMTPPPPAERTGHEPYFVDLELPFEDYDAPYILG